MAMANADASTSTGGPPALNLEPARRRRVPDHLRQRIEISCDRCKKRKRRCIRTGDETICVGCQEAGAECRATLPRKRRPTISTPSARYAILDSIVRKVYSGDNDVDSVEGLKALASKLGAGAVSGTAHGHGHVGEEDDDGEEGDGEEDKEHLHSQSHSSRGPQILPSDVPEGWLVPAPKGGHHYVGPASLVFFARCARELVTKSNTQPAYDEQGLRRYLQATEFTRYKVSHTIEANIQGHPATVAAHEGPSPSGLSMSGMNGSGIGLSPHDGSIRLRGLDRGIADRLVGAYFDRVHTNFPVLHRGAYQVQYERTFDQAPRHDPGWTCTLAMVYTLGAQSLEDTLPSAQQIQQDYLSVVVREGLGRLILTSTLSNVQALLLLALYQHNAGERNTAWILVGQAIRSAVALGLHRDGENSTFDPFERNIRRTVWWVLHLFEQYVSLALGRPSFSDAINVNARLPEASYEIGIGLARGYLEHHVSLSRFIVKIKQAVATASVCYSDATRLVELLPAVMAIHSDLISWKKNTPPGLGLGQAFTTPAHRRLVFLLLIWSDYLESVLCRPYLLCRVSHDLQQSKCPEEVEEVASLSVSAAQASVTKLLVLADHGLLEGSVWLDFYAAQHAIMVSSLHVLGQPRPTDPDIAADDQSLKEGISRLIQIAQQTRLAPTYRITLNVALQLACIAGIGPDMLVRVQDPPSTSPGVVPSPNAPIQPQTLQPDQINPPNSINPSNPANPVNPANPPNTLNSLALDPQGCAQLEELFGPMPPSAVNSEPDMFADLYNFGYMEDPLRAWDFFNVGGLNQGGLEVPLDSFAGHGGLEGQGGQGGNGSHPWNSGQ